ncbi:ribosomal RNA small subunit methyltransferase E [Agaricicola taiwanensis]|uniref:Ribosomal RNA small subunit methyltransferase E n=1 Tax=Agaricicola taiwanensis TaxID=591372 RepID=A0A8J2VRH6_9RHOB|nr:16S rRNA (uracil(1498)-N(3))-methyltransferase [Agaricicola taiwanensis]GGE34437.1 ribosomal RNA small subunit methyltransferase E [Agaricicola taiwanensis]
MASYDFAAQRLYVEEALAAGADVVLEGSQANYLKNVLRLAEGDQVLLFNGRDGEWRSRLSAIAKRRVTLVAEELVRPQQNAGDLWYVFAPLKHARLDYMVEKAVEMGASRLMPVFTRRTQASRVNGERMRANAIEAAEQCGILNVPGIAEPAPLEKVLDAWPPERTMIFCDEDAGAASAVETLAQAKPAGPLAVLVGPEGGFDESERARLLRLPSVVRLSLGPRILRADTAAVAALTVVQAVLGDWTAPVT